MKEDRSKMFSRRKFIRNTSCFAGFIGLNSMSSGFTAAAETGDAKGKLHVKKEGGYFIIESPFFAFCLDVTDGLKAMWWLNKLSNRKLNMGKGDEIRFTVGLPGEKIIIPRLKVDKAPGTGSQPLNEVVFELSGEEVNAKVKVAYKWNGIEPVMTKVADIRNEGAEAWNRLLDINLGSYSTNAIPFKDPDWPVLKTKLGWLAVTTEFSKNGEPFLSLNNRPVSMTGYLDGESIGFEAALANTHYSAPWQTYRLKVNGESSGKEFKLTSETRLDKDVELIIKGHFIPQN